MNDVLFKIVNKYKGCVYEVIYFDTVERKVRLRRPDGSEFVINMSEYRDYYKVVGK